MRHVNPTLFLVLAGMACASDPPEGAPGGDSDTVEPTTSESSRPKLANPPTNLLLITSDTTRVHHFNVNGYSDRVTTPNIDRLLLSGLHLTNHKSCASWTFASFLCMLTGRDQVDVGHVPDNNHGGVGAFPDDSLPSIARILKDRGYNTALIYGNNFLSSEFNMAQGYDSEERNWSALDGQPKVFGRLDDLVSQSDPWMVHYHFNDAHSMYTAPIEYLDDYVNFEGCPNYNVNNRDEYTRLKDEFWTLTPEEQDACVAKMVAKYDGVLNYVDEYLQAIVDHVEELGALDDTLVVIATDHGEEFFEHGDWAHGQTAFREVVSSVVGFVHSEIDGEQISTLTAHEDVLPTVFHFMDIDPPAEVKGRPAWEGREVQHHLSYRNHDTVQAVRNDSEKLIYHWEGDKFFFDLEADPLELNNLYDPTDLRVIALWDLLEPKVDEIAVRVASDGVRPVDPGP